MASIQISITVKGVRSATDPAAERFIKEEFEHEIERNWGYRDHNVVVEIQEADEPLHIVTFNDGGWVIQHPLACRPNLRACEYNRAASNVPPNGALGTYHCTLADDGYIQLVGDPIEES